MTNTDSQYLIKIEALCSYFKTREFTTLYYHYDEPIFASNPIGDLLKLRHYWAHTAPKLFNSYVEALTKAEEIESGKIMLGLISDNKPLQFDIRRAGGYRSLLVKRYTEHEELYPIFIDHQGIQIITQAQIAV